MEKSQTNEVFLRWCGKAKCKFWPWPCNVGLEKKKKKKVAPNFLKFCMEVYNLILSTSGKDLEKIPTNEVFTCTFWPRPCNVGLGKKKQSCSEFSQILHGGL